MYIVRVPLISAVEFDVIQLISENETSTRLVSRVKSKEDVHVCT